MSVTIEEVMRLVGQYGDAVLEGPALPQIEAIHAALLALVAQARDEEAEKCQEICVAQGVEWDSDAVVTNKNYADYCAFLIRDRILARKGE